MEKIAILFAGLLVGCGARAAAPPECHEPTADPVQPVVEREPLTPEPAVDTEVSADDLTDEETDVVQVVAGTCERRMLPPGLHRELDDQTSTKLREQMTQWLNGPWGHQPFIPRRGIAFAKSADDSGADEPLPSWENAQSLHACGIQARWLVASLRQRFIMQGGPEGQAPVTCDGNVCCYDDMGEYSSSGGIAFEVVGEAIHLRAAWEVADNGTIGEEYAAGLYDGVRAQLTRHLRGTCRGEPE